jgi:hypothetical protein
MAPKLETVEYSEDLTGRVGPGPAATDAERAEYLQGMRLWYLETYGDELDDDTDDTGKQ